MIWMKTKMILAKIFSNQLKIPNKTLEFFYVFLPYLLSYFVGYFLFLIYNFDMKKLLGLYIHIPFCEKKCDYCNFVSFCKNDKEKKKYVECLLKEIAFQGKNYSKNEYAVDTIFVGGGTPTVLPFGEISKIFECIKSNFVVEKNAEITVECNPNSLTLEKLEEFKKSGVNRLSIGLQTYNNKLLKLIGRLHTKKEFDIAIKNAKEVGFTNINVDLILGIPNQKIFDVKREIKHLKKLGIPHISCYGLIVEENTKLSQNLERKVYKLPSEEKSVKMYDIANKMLSKSGINRYEVSNFAKSGFECKHNLKYWQDKEYLGLGVVSSSYVDGKRWKNTDSLKMYCEFFENFDYKKFETNDKSKTNNLKNDIQSNFNLSIEEIVEDMEILSKQSKMEECVMLSLRTIQGIDLIEFNQKFEIDLLQQKKYEIEDLKIQNMIDIQNNHLFCTNDGFKLLNQIILQLI